MSPASISLERAILEALAYSDIFDHPLRFDELHRYLPTRAGKENLSSALTSLDGQIGTRGEYFFLAGRDDIVEIRKQRLARSENLLPHALRYGRILGALPFIRMVALTGSLAMLNISKNADFDYMLVAAKGRVWTARAFALALNRVARLFGHTICPNLIVSESALEWRLHDLYSARELVQMIPIAGMDVYRRVMEVNAWVRACLPNSFDANAAKRERNHSRNSPLRDIRVKSLLEFPLQGKFGDKLEAWEMTRKIARFSNQPGFGEETVFNAEVCQGNFHHHRKWTREILEQKLSALEKEVTVTFKVTVT
ncbi:MAG: hypothetical protein MHPDNHAH_02738 [Anaerolineales bacterium]|nr:hypothetical protein [Anaerolineales bacterium]WKZ47500.1 MAG: hypothetical protein QY306_16935 [Anaerolineales bacterium]